MTNDSTTAENTGAVEPARTTATERADTWMNPFERLGLDDWFGRWPAWFGSRFPLESMTDTTPIRIEEIVEDGQFVVRAEMPGFDPDEDIDVSIDGRQLTIAAHREQRATDDENGGRSEFRYGSFARVITLPDETDASEVSASYVNGILEVRMPHVETEQTAARKIRVETR